MIPKLTKSSFFFLFLFFLFFSCSKWNFERVGFTEIVTVGVIEVGSNGAFLLGDVKDLRNIGIVESGFVLSSTNLEESNLHLEQAGVFSVISQDLDTVRQERAFAARITGLQASTTYAFRAYAKVAGEDQVLYGNVENFSTTNLMISLKKIRRASDNCETLAKIEVSLDGLMEDGETALGLIWSNDIYFGPPSDFKGNLITENSAGSSPGSIVFDLPVECSQSYTVVAYASNRGSNSVYSELASFSTVIGGQWVPKATFPGEMRDLSVSFSIDDFFYLAGGKKPFQPYREKNYIFDFWAYSAQSDTWSEIGQLEDGISSPFATTLDGMAYFGSGQWSSEKCLEFLGGNCNSTSPGDCDLCHCMGTDFFKFDPVTQNWTKIIYPDSITSIIYRHGSTAMAIGSKVYLGLGNNTKSCDRVINYVNAVDNLQNPIRLRNSNFFTFKDMWQFDPISEEWTQMQSYPNEERIRAINYSLDNKGYVGLGSYYRDENESLQTGPLNDFYEFDPAQPIGRQWSTLQSFPEEIEYSNSFVHGDLGYILVKTRSFLTTSVALWKFDRKEGPLGTWSQISSDVIPGITGLPSAAEKVGNAVFVYFAGPTQNFWMYIPELN